MDALALTILAVAGIVAILWDGPLYSIMHYGRR
jgi:hypothetical protein